MRSRNGVLTSRVSSIVSMIIDGDSFVGGIENLKVTKVSNDSVTLSWDTVQGVEGYRITPKGKASYSVLDPRFSTLPTTTVTHLAPGAFYTFQVSGYRKGFDGWAAQVTATTKGNNSPHNSKA
jgi:Fibronectin type III domain